MKKRLFLPAVVLALASAAASAQAKPAQRAAKSPTTTKTAEARDAVDSLRKNPARRGGGVSSPAARNEDFEKGEELFLLNRPGKAIEYFEKSLESAAGVDPKVYVYLGICHYQTGDYAKSLEVCARGMKAEGADRKILAYNAGNSCYALGDYRRAEENYAAALGEDGGYSPAVLNRANALLRLERYSDAREGYAKYLEMEPNTAQREKIEELIGLLAQEIESSSGERPELIKLDVIVENERMDVPGPVEKVEGELIAAQPPEFARAADAAGAGKAVPPNEPAERVEADALAAQPEERAGPARADAPGERVSGEPLQAAAVSQGASRVPSSPSEMVASDALAPEIPPEQLQIEGGQEDALAGGAGRASDRPLTYSDRARIEEEIRKFEEERLRLEEARRAAEDETRRLETERRAVEDEKKRLEQENRRRADEESERIIGERRRQAEEDARAAEEKRRKADEDAERIAAEKLALEEERRSFEKARMDAEIEAERRALEEERRRIEESKKAFEAEQRRAAEESRRRQEEEAARKAEETRLAEEKARAAEERRRIEDARREIEAEQRRINEESRRIEEESRKVEEQRRADEHRRAEEQAARAAEEARAAETASWPEPQIDFTASSAENFTPDGDGQNDTVEFRQSIKFLEEKPAGWSLSIFDPQGNLFRSMKGEGDVPALIEWDGIGDKGDVVLSKNTYTARLSVRLSDRDRRRLGRQAVERSVEINSGMLLQVIVPGKEWKMVVNSINFVPNGALSPDKLTREQMDWNNDTLDEIVRQINEHPGASVVVVEGYANNVSGTERENREELIPLSQMRADAIIEELVRRGVRRDLLQASGRGGADPIAAHSDRANWYKNRRVEFKIMK